MKRALLLALVVVSVLPLRPASAQTETARWTGEFLAGLLVQGELATARFAADFSGFGGNVVVRQGGTLDVVPTGMFGVRTGYRVANNLYLLASWQHSEGRYRIVFPALASDTGDFNLEGLILAGNDFLFAGPDTRAESATSTAVSDFYLASVRFEFPTMDGWFFPYMTTGAGWFTQRSQGDVIEVTFQGELPPFEQFAEIAGINTVGLSGLSVFKIHSSEPLFSIGAGFRASLGKKWGVTFEIQDMMRIKADLSSINASATPFPPEPPQQIWATAFEGTEGIIHNLSIAMSANYAFWPYGAPR